MERAIQIKNITKLYKNTIALNNVSLNFEFGKIYGLLGRNGAGKSTLINIIANRKFPNDGEVFIDNLKARENMQISDLLFCATTDDLYPKSHKVKNIFKWTNTFYDSFDLDKSFDLAKKFNLNINKSFTQLSKGYQTIMKLIIGLSLNLPYMIYDEPVLGLDANHRELFYSLLLKDFQENEKTIIIATHLIEEIANMIEEVIIIDDGKIILEKNSQQLSELGYSVSGLKEDVDKYCLNKKVLGFDEIGNLKIAYVMEPKTDIDPNLNLTISKLNLQKLFVKLTDKGEQSNE